jgi:hypothetical protein
MKRKYILTVIAVTLSLAGVVWSQSGPSIYSLSVSPGGSTSCSALELLSPPLYKCSSMKLFDVSGVQIGTADWGFTNNTLLLTVEKKGDVMNYALPAAQTLTSGNATYPSCSAEWTIQTKLAPDTPEVTIHLSEYKSGGGRAPEGCRASWKEGTIIQ